MIICKIVTVRCYLLKVNQLFILLFSMITFILYDCKNSSGENAPEGLNHISKILFLNTSNVNASTQEKNDVASLKNSLFISGLGFNEIASDKISLTDLTGYDLIVIPCSSAKELNPKDLELVKKAVTSGTNLLFDGVSNLNIYLNINIQKSGVKVTRIRDLQFKDNLLYWNVPAVVQPVESANSVFVPLCVSDSTGSAIAVKGSIGKGKIVYYSALFDPNTDKGYSRFPYLIETLSNIFGIKRLTSRRVSEMFYDDAMKNDSLSYDSLASHWRKYNIKRIYASGWYLEDSDKYEKLIKACHDNGIIVCCWLETPMISKAFWDAHPEWREKTAYLKDANIDWRFLMNLEDTNCLNAVYKEFEKLLMNHDWDGVNLAELYFEPSPVGPEYPENFTPMNQIVRKEFNKLAGFDPYYLFDETSPHYWKTDAAGWRKFADYRKELCMRRKTKMLNYLSSVKSRKKDFELMLTVIDVSLTPELSDNIGEDTRNALKLYRTYKLTLQVEDPSNCWGTTPSRYDQMGRFYRKYIKPENELVFDCNVVASHEKGFGGFPSEKPTGEEIRQIAYNMNLSRSRPTFYSEDAIFLNDFANLSTVLAHDTKLSEVSNNLWKVVSPKTVMINSGISGLEVKMDGKPWYARDGIEITVPPGEHNLVFTTNKNKSGIANLLMISGELLSANFSPGSFELNYMEDVAPCYITVDKKPLEVKIDNTVYAPLMFSDSKNRFTLKLPLGNHKVRILFNQH